MTTVVSALTALRPGAQWSITGSAITWLDEQQTRPTDEEIAAWIAAPPQMVPETVSAAQARLALLAAGLLDPVDAAVAAAVSGGNRALGVWFEYATEWRRDSPHIAALGPALGLSSAQIDDLFVAAAGIV